MHPEEINKNNTGKPVDIGNASNAGPQNEEFEPADSDNQLLDKNAEKYLRQVTSPEEMPDAEESQEYDEQDSNSKT